MGTYDIVQNVPFSNPNYNITLIKGTMTIKNTLAEPITDNTADINNDGSSAPDSNTISNPKTGSALPVGAVALLLAGAATIVVMREKIIILF